MSKISNVNRGLNDKELANKLFHYAGIKSDYFMATICGEIFVEYMYCRLLNIWSGFYSGVYEYLFIY